MYFVAFRVIFFFFFSDFIFVFALRWARANAFDTDLKVKWCAARKPLVFALIHIYELIRWFGGFKHHIVEIVEDIVQSHKNANSMSRSIKERERASKRKQRRSKKTILLGQIFVWFSWKHRKKDNNNFVTFCVCRLSSLLRLQLKASH